MKKFKNENFEDNFKEYIFYYPYNNIRNVLKKFEEK
jgi:hypothetical protein